MRFRTKKTKLATVHRLPVTSRLQRAGQTTVSCDLAAPLTREEITSVVYQLIDAWGYTLVFEGDTVKVHALVDPFVCLSGDILFVAANLPKVVECLMIAQG